MRLSGRSNSATTGRSPSTSSLSQRTSGSLASSWDDLCSVAQCKGYITKCGGSVRSWKKRYMLLKDGVLYYFAKEGAKAPKGTLDLGPDDSAHAVSNSDKSPFMIGINTPKRTYLMFPETREEQEQWLAAVNGAVATVKAMTRRTKSGVLPNVALARTSGSGEIARSPAVRRVRAEMKQRALSLSNPEHSFDCRDRLLFARDKLHWNSEDAEKVCIKFWELWMGHFPQAVKESDQEEDAQCVREGGQEKRRSCITMQWSIAISASKDRSRWEGSSSCPAMIQGVVDFFWAAGGHDMHMLAELGNLIRPSNISLWLELTSSGGVEAGYSFRVEEECGEPCILYLKKGPLTEWYSANKHRVTLRQIWAECSGRPKRFWRLLWNVRYSDIEELLSSLSIPFFSDEALHGLEVAKGVETSACEALTLWVSASTGNIVGAELRIPVQVAIPAQTLPDVEKTTSLRASHATYYVTSPDYDAEYLSMSRTGAGLEWENAPGLQETFFVQ